MSHQPELPDHFTMTIALPGGTIQTALRNQEWQMALGDSVVATGRGAESLHEAFLAAARAACRAPAGAAEESTSTVAKVTSDLDTETAAQLLSWWEQVFDIDDLYPEINGIPCPLTVFGIPAPEYDFWPEVAWLDWELNGGGSPAASRGKISVHEWCGHEAYYDYDFGWEAADSPDFGWLARSIDEMQSEPDTWITEYTDTRQPDSDDQDA